MTDIYAITVSTRYSDLRNIIIKQNAKFFKKWYIITYPADKDTIKVVRDASLSNVELLFYDFYTRSGRKYGNTLIKQAGSYIIFNKGGAIHCCKKHIISKVGIGKPILLIDSDIYLPDNFLDVIDSTTISPNTLYGIAERYDFSRMSDFISRKYNNPAPNAKDFFGFFQLYIQKPNTFYNNSRDCTKCDIDFHTNFTNFVNLPLAVYHLGKSGVH